MPEAQPAIVVPVQGQETQIIATPVVSIGPSNVVLSDITGITGASVISNCVAISQVDYDAIVVYDPNTLYVIV